MVTFVDLTNQALSIKDKILSDMLYDGVSKAQAAASFSAHLRCTKNWYIRISWVNKKRFLLELVDGAGSRAISLVLQATWNSWTKDALLSISRWPPACGYDQVPLDNNRTALPESLLVQVMQAEEQWFFSLDQGLQGLVLLELLLVSGGPLVWETSRQCRKIYEQQWKRREELTFTLRSSIDELVIDESSASKMMSSEMVLQGKKNTTATNKKKLKLSAQRLKKTSKSDFSTSEDKSEAETELETRLAAWETWLGTTRAKLNMSEEEVTSHDGCRTKIWRVAMRSAAAVPAETVDYIQLLPAPLAKCILSYLPRASHAEYAKVNKYWAYLLDDLKAEVATRQRIQQDMARLREMLIHGAGPLKLHVDSSTSGDLDWSRLIKSPPARPLPASDNSRRKAAVQGLNKTRKPANPVPNLHELTERLEIRGAADGDVFWWCQNILRRGYEVEVPSSGVAAITTDLKHFPCPLMSKSVKIPVDLQRPMSPAPSASRKSRKN